MKEYQVIEDQLLETIFQAFHIRLKNEEKISGKRWITYYLKQN